MSPYCRRCLLDRLLQMKTLTCLRGGGGTEGDTDPETRYYRLGKDAGKNYNLNLDNLDDVGWIKSVPQVRRCYSSG